LPAHSNADGNLWKGVALRKRIPKKRVDGLLAHGKAGGRVIRFVGIQGTAIAAACRDLEGKLVRWPKAQTVLEIYLDEDIHETPLRVEETEPDGDDSIAKREVGGTLWLVNK
jgi:hypothetical protein